MSASVLSADYRPRPRHAPARSVVGILLLIPTGLLAGCGDGGSGWARIEPAGSLSLTDSRIFDSVSASLQASIDGKHPIRPLVISGEIEQPGPGGKTVRAWRLFALVTPSDMPSRVNVIALLGRSQPGGRQTWRFFTSQGDVEYWSYADRVMIYGQIQPGDRKDTDPVLHQVFSASLDGRSSSREFRATVQDMVTLLEQIRGRYGSMAGYRESVEALDDAVEVLRKAVGKG